MKVVFVDLSAFEGVLPLAAGYMQAYAQQDAELDGACRFEIFSASIENDRERIRRDLLAHDADLYAFSCYVWNMSLVKWLLGHLRTEAPAATVILGGPQVINHGHDYIPDDDERVFVCNGEGERTFSDFLRELLADEPDFSRVAGLTYRAGGELVTTPPATRIATLDEIPSPYREEIFEPGRYAFAILETNRGCPFRCGFCFWGAATNDRVYRFDEDRVRREIAWISDNMFPSVFIVDANWGMLPRDVALTEYLVERAQETGYPMMVAMASAKNSPDRVVKITELLVNGGLLTSQPIALQTLSDVALEQVDRANIKRETYEQLQRTLVGKGISSYIELIWPLPGETLASYEEGIGALCRAGADTIIVYPQLLLHNTPLIRNREALGLRVRRVGNASAEADVVIETHTTTSAEFEAGVHFYYAMHALYNLRGLYYLSRYLVERRGLSFEQIFRAAASFFASRSGHRLTDFFEESIAGLWNYEFQNSGIVAHILLHEARAECDALLADLVKTEGWDRDPAALAAFELDLVTRPYIYAEPARLPTHPFEALDVTAEDGLLTVEATLDLVEAVKSVPELAAAITPGDRLVVEHCTGRKLPFMANAPLVHSASYCQGMLLRMRELLPALRTAAHATVS